jgi:hypothetical protein
MPNKSLLFFPGLAVLLACPVACAEIANPHVVVERESLKVLTAGNFPKDLASEIYIGPTRSLPWFTAEGRHGRVETASIEVIDTTNTEGDIKDSSQAVLGKGTVRSTISVLRKEGVKDSYVLYLFSEDRDGKVFGLFDLNFDGQWDVKKTPTWEKQNFIFVGSEWLEVDRIDGLQSTKPTAVRGAIRYEFQETWKQVH